MYFSPPLPLPAATGVLYIPKIEELFSSMLR